jgi:hypothetical protein
LVGACGRQARGLGVGWGGGRCAAWPVVKAPPPPKKLNSY